MCAIVLFKAVPGIGWIALSTRFRGRGFDGSNGLRGRVYGIAEQRIMDSTAPASRLRTWFLSDARHFQIVFLASFLLYGILLLGWDADLVRYACLIGTCLAVQAFFIRLKKLDPRSWKSAM